MDGVYSKSIHSGKWFLANMLVQKTLSLVTFFILARLLLPEDYGVMTIVLLITGTLNVLTVFPFSDAVMQTKEEIEPFLDPMWTIDVFRALLLSILIALAAEPLAAFFHLDGSALAIIRLSGILLLIQSLSNVRQLYFFKQLDFRRVFFRDLVGQLAYLGTAVAYAWFVQPSTWALFYGYCALYATAAIASYVLAPARPAFSIRFRALRQLIPFTSWMYAQDVLDYALGQIDKLVVGRLLDPAQLGVYSKSKDLSSMATAIVTSVISKVGFPAFSLIQDKMEKVRIGFLKSVDVLLLGALPFTLLLLMEGGAIVRILLGERWLVLVVPLKIFAFGNLFLAFTRIVTPVLSALHRPDVNVTLNVVQVVLSVPFMMVGYRISGFRGLAVAVVAVWGVMLLVAMWRAKPILQIPKRDFLPAFLSGGAASLGLVALDVLLRLFRGVEPSWIVSIIQILILGLAYFGILFLVSVWRGAGPVATLVSIIRELRAAQPIPSDRSEV